MSHKHDLVDSISTPAIEALWQIICAERDLIILKETLQELLPEISVTVGAEPLTAKAWNIL